MKPLPETIRAIKARLGVDEVVGMLEALGYEVDTRNLRFKLRPDERTPSAHIKRDTLLIKDFGGDFSGDIFDLLERCHGMTKREAVQFVADFTGGHLEPVQAPSKPRPLPQPKKPPDGAVRAFYERMRAGKREAVQRHGKETMARRFYEELVPRPLRTGMDDAAIDRMVGYDLRNDSFTVALFDGDEPVTVAVRRASYNDRTVKWFTPRGHAKSFIPYRVAGDGEVYAVFGTKEILLLEGIGWNYIGFQSDSTAKAVARNERAGALLEAVRGRRLVLLLDNDDSCRATVAPLHDFFGGVCEVAPVDFADLLFDRELPKGYDFWDFAAWCESWEIVQWMIADYIDGVPPHDILDHDMEAA